MRIVPVIGTNINEHFSGIRSSRRDAIGVLIILRSLIDKNLSRTLTRKIDALSFSFYLSPLGTL